MEDNTEGTREAEVWPASSEIDRVQRHSTLWELLVSCDGNRQSDTGLPAASEDHLQLPLVTTVISNTLPYSICKCRKLLVVALSASLFHSFRLFVALFPWCPHTSH